MGLGLWMVASLVSLLLARAAPWNRRSRWTGETLFSLLSGFLLGVVATAADFGGWSEPDWRAGLFVFAGTLAILGMYRLGPHRQ